MRLRRRWWTGWRCVYEERWGYHGGVDGDVRSKEFWAPAVYRAKVKTPLEFVVSAVRASDADGDQFAAAGAGDG